MMLINNVQFLSHDADRDPTPQEPEEEKEEERREQKKEQKFYLALL